MIIIDALTTFDLDFNLEIAGIFHAYTLLCTYPIYNLFLGLTDISSLGLLTLFFIVVIGYILPCGARAQYDIIRLLGLFVCRFV